MTLECAVKDSFNGGKGVWVNDIMFSLPSCHEGHLASVYVAKSSPVLRENKVFLICPCGRKALLEPVRIPSAEQISNQLSKPVSRMRVCKSDALHTTELTCRLQTFHKG